jgi:hypothetical protein
MSPLSKVEMSPLLGCMALEMLYGGENTNEHQGSNKARSDEANGQ